MTTITQEIRVVPCKYLMLSVAKPYWHAAVIRFSSWVKVCFYCPRPAIARYMNLGAKLMARVLLLEESCQSFSCT